MEHLWSPAGATGGNRWQMGHPRKPLKQADPQPVATHGNGQSLDGKEGVNGSSPLERFRKALHCGVFLVFPDLQIVALALLWSLLWSPQIQRLRLIADVRLKQADPRRQHPPFGVSRRKIVDCGSSHHVGDTDAADPSRLHASKRAMTPVEAWTDRRRVRSDDAARCYRRRASGRRVAAA